MSGDQERDAPWQHPDDKFRLRDQENMCLRDEVVRLKQQIFSLEPKLLTKGYEIQLDDLSGEVTRLKQVCRNVYEVWAGSDGIPKPETAGEKYLLRKIMEMRDEAKEGLK